MFSRYTVQVWNHDVLTSFLIYTHTVMQWHPSFTCTHFPTIKKSCPAARHSPSSYSRFRVWGPKSGSSPVECSYWQTKSCNPSTWSIKKIYNYVYIYIQMQDLVLFICCVLSLPRRVPHHILIWLYSNLSYLCAYWIVSLCSSRFDTNCFQHELYTTFSSGIFCFLEAVWTKGCSLAWYFAGGACPFALSEDWWPAEILVW